MGGVRRGWCLVRLEGVTTNLALSRPGPLVAGKGAVGAHVQGVPPSTVRLLHYSSQLWVRRDVDEGKNSKLASSIMAGDGDVYTWIVTLSKQASSYQF
jgi:hypothetical protein